MKNLSYLHLPRPYILFCLYIVILILLPAGTFLGFNFKALIFVPLVLFAVRQTIKEKEGLRHLALGTGILTILTFWVFLAQVYHFSNINMSLVQYKDVIATLVGCWFVRLFTVRQRDREIFIKLCLYTTAFLGLVKVGIFAYSLRSGVSISAVMDSISRIFGVQLMTFDLEEALGRIQFPSDTLVPVCLFVVLSLRKRLRVGSISSLFLVAFLLASSIFTFSRFLWGYTTLGVALGVLVSKRDKLHWLYLSLTAAVVGYYSTLIVTLIQLRFSRAVVNASDADRILQRTALQQFFEEAPLFGHGFGTFTNVVIRQSELPYNYEMQLLALSTQIGIVGMLLMTILLINYYRKSFTFSRGDRLFQLAVLLLLVAFLTGALFNPSVISSIAAATFGLLFALGSTKTCVQEEVISLASMDALPN